MTIGPAELAHVAALARLDSHSPGGGWSEERFAQELALAWSNTIVAVQAELLGFVVYWRVAEDLEIHNLVTDPKHRRTGVARRLVTCVQDEARSLGGRVLLEVRQRNMPARALYQSLGFRETGVRRGYYPEGAGEPADDAVLMEWSP